MLTLVVGAQYGGEGKGKICSYLGAARQFPYVCRTGGVNSSHAVQFRNRFYKLRMMPASAVVSSSTYLFGAGSLIHIETLRREMDELGVADDRVVIDSRAGVVSEDCVAAQRLDERYERLGSTLTGTGYATAERSLRRLKLAIDYPELQTHIGDVTRMLYNANRADLPILVEGHQGMGLSNYHGDYPYTSSRDCTAAAIMSEIGVGPLVNIEVILVVKMFPTRNHAGTLPSEMPNDEAGALGIFERGGGAWGLPDRRRRVGRLNWNDVERAVMLNSPTMVALTGFDYAFPETAGQSDQRKLSPAARKFVEEFERRIGVSVGLISTGPDVYSTISLTDGLAIPDDRWSATSS